MPTATEVITPGKIEDGLDPLLALAPTDGRYAKELAALRPHTTEFALIRNRFTVEATYLVALSEMGLMRPLAGNERDTLLALGPSLTLAQARRVKDIEATNRHDVKAMEIAFRELVAGTSLSDTTEKIHIFLTSEDVNNLAYRMMLRDATQKVCVPTLHTVTDTFAQRAEEYKDMPMLARTHGQPAVPTTLGKEFINFGMRLQGELKTLEQAKLTGKLNGAVGNYNVFRYVAPGVDWITFSKNFVKQLGFEPNLYTTQINPSEDMIKLFQTYQRVNGVMIDFDQDMWRYISDDWLVQQKKEGEVGSSVMAQKINPIRFENSEGNLIMANGMFETMNRQLAVSRLQRDLSGSTVIRNLSPALGHSLLSYNNALAGLRTVYPDAEYMKEVLYRNWTILSEAAQTRLRWAGVEDPYTLVADRMKGKRIGTSAEWSAVIRSLPVDEGIQAELEQLNPEGYLGDAVRLTEMGVAEIRGIGSQDEDIW